MGLTLGPQGVSTQGVPVYHAIANAGVPSRSGVLTSTDMPALCPLVCSDLCGLVPQLCSRGAMITFRCLPVLQGCLKSSHALEACERRCGRDGYRIGAWVAAFQLLRLSDKRTIPAVSDPVCPWTTRPGRWGFWWALEVSRFDHL